MIEVNEEAVCRGEEENSVSLPDKKKYTKISLNLLFRVQKSGEICKKFQM